MKNLDGLRRFLLPCTSPSTNTNTTTTISSKNRISTSLLSNEKNKPYQEQEQQPEKKKDSTTTTLEEEIIPAVPQRPSKTMVLGTIFGKRKGHVWFCVQHDRLSLKPILLLELSIPTHHLVHEMQSGLVRIALESPTRPELSSISLRSIPIWTMYCNGRKLGFAVRRSANEHNKVMLKTMQSMTVGAGVMPFGEEEVMYMRANYEHIVGSSDSESFHLINPDESSGQELSIFLLRPM